MGDDEYSSLDDDDDDFSLLDMDHAEDEIGQRDSDLFDELEYCIDQCRNLLPILTDVPNNLGDADSPETRAYFENYGSMVEHILNGVVSYQTYCSDFIPSRRNAERYVFLTHLLSVIINDDNINVEINIRAPNGVAFGAPHGVAFGGPNGPGGIQGYNPEDFGEDVRRGLTREEIRQRTREVHFTTILSDDNNPLGMSRCTICLDDYEEKESLRALQCDHLFHEVCLATWLERKKTCPLCLRKVKKRPSSSTFDISTPAPEMVSGASADENHPRLRRSKRLRGLPP